MRIQQEIQAGTLAIADCTTAGSGPGPRTMTPVVKNLLIASADQVAIDAVAAKLIGFDPMTVPCIRLGHENGLGKGRMDEIDIIGDLDNAEVQKPIGILLLVTTQLVRLAIYSGLDSFKPLAKINVSNTDGQCIYHGKFGLS